MNILKIATIVVVGFCLQIMIFTTNSSASAVNKRILVVYFSMPETTNPKNMTDDEANSTVVIDNVVIGNVQYFASLIQEKTGSTLFRIEAADPYPTNHSKLLDRAKMEQEKNARPALKGKIENLAEYDIIFIGYPIWYYQLPMIMRTFFEQHDFAGKTIIPFNVHGGSGFSGTVEVIARMQPKATVSKNGISISRDRIQDSRDDIFKWLDNLDLLK